MINLDMILVILVSPLCVFNCAQFWCYFFGESPSNNGANSNVLLPNARPTPAGIIPLHCGVQCKCYILSFRSLSYGRSLASAKSGSPHNAVYWFLLQIPVSSFAVTSARNYLLLLRSCLSFKKCVLVGSSYAWCDQCGQPSFLPSAVCRMFLS